jgi:glyoxylase-like metal-dependent hydrolase (beta-lactamase superfamily II)
MADASLSSRVLGSPHAVRAPEVLRGLDYPFGRWVPGEGEMFEVLDGVWWLRMPLPMGGLDHINLWALEDGDGWVLVDCGLGDARTRGLWEALFAGAMGGRPVTRVIATHFHPDHVGHAGWLCGRWDVALEMTRAEYLMARMLQLDVQPEAPQMAIDYWRQAGWPDEVIAAQRVLPWGRYAKLVPPLPGGYRRLVEGQVLRIGGRDWRVVVGRGHAPEHACLVCDEAMISGDQVLPRITSNVSVFPTEPLANPLADWLESIRAMRGLDADLLVLPAHNEPFRGLHTRLDQLDADHEDKLARLAAFCEVPRTAFACFSVLFRRPVSDGDRAIATGEALAHLHWLEGRGELRRTVEGGVVRFVRG